MAFTPATATAKTTQSLSTAARPSVIACATDNKGILGWALSFTRKIASGQLAGLKEFNESNDQKEIGIQNFQGNKLEDNESLKVDYLRIDYDFAPTADNAKQQDVVYDKNFPAFLRNGILQVKTKNGNKPVVEEQLSVFDPRTTGNNIGDKMYKLRVPFIIKGGETFQFQIRLPENGTQPTGNDHFIKIEAYGIKTIS